MNALKKILMLLIVCIIYNLPVLYGYNNISNIGIVDQYTVDNLDNNMALSRNGSPAINVYPGNVISLYGDYALTLKNKNKIIRFTIKPNRDNLLNITIQNDISLYMAILFSLEDGGSSYTFKTNKNYKGNDNIKNKIKQFHKEIYDAYPLIDLYEYEYLIYSDRIQFNYTRRMDKSLYAAATKGLKDKLNQFILSLDLNKQDIELEKQIASFIITNYQYDKRKDNVPPDALSRTIQGAYLGNELVCSSYSKLAMYLLNNIGIQTRYVVGSTKDGSSHAWNIVKLEDEYYHLDLTFADTSIQGKDGSYYQYINEKDAYMKASHVWDEDKYPKCASNTYFNLNIYLLKKVDATTIDNVEDLDKPLVIPSTDDVYVKSLMSKLANNLGRSFKYYGIKKYNHTVVVFE